jgi:Mg-chelatase subunit ChlD
MNTVMKWPASLVLSAALGWSALAGAAPQKGGPAKPRTRQVFVNVTGQNGSPVLDLGAGDFEVTESGTKREIGRAALATAPMRIALIVDTSDGAAAALNQVRAGLLAFIDAVPPEHEIMIVSTGRQTRVRVPPTTDRKKAKDSAGGLFPDGGATVLGDTLLEMDDRFMRKAEDRWPVFVIITGDGAEGSAGANEKKLNDWIVAVPPRGISAHAFVLKYKGGGMPEIIASHVVQAAGGRYDFMNTSNSLPEKLKELGEHLAASAKQMASWYRVEFATTGPENAPVDVGITRAGVAVKLSYRRQP